MGREYSEPDTGAYFKPADNIGTLLLLDVLEYRTDYKGYDEGADDRDGVEVEVTVLDGDLAGEVYLKSTVHQGKLVAALKRKVGGSVLGRLTQGPKVGKKAGAYELGAPTDADKKVADTFLAATGEVPF